MAHKWNSHYWGRTLQSLTMVFKRWFNTLSCIGEDCMMTFVVCASTVCILQTFCNKEIVNQRGLLNYKITLKKRVKFSCGECGRSSRPISPWWTFYVAYKASSKQTPQLCNSSKFTTANHVSLVQRWPELICSEGTKAQCHLWKISCKEMAIAS